METIKEKITVSALVNAPIDKVWKYWSEPEHITQWNQASEDWHTPKAQNDLRTGGKFSSTMAAKDGSMSFEFEGTYSNVEAHKLIEYAMPDGREVKVVFEQKGDHIKVVETFDPEGTHSLEMQKDGWQAILDSFKRYVEGA